MKIRVRIAPSPTGYLHLGTARTALFNYLFAKHNDGVFLLRIEDTDLERSDPKFEREIIESLQWLGIKWDEEPIKQSQRLDVYEKYIKQLLDKKLAYYCECNKEQLEEEREAMLAQGLAPRYSGRCRGKDLEPGPGRTIRLKVPEQHIVFNDLIRGKLDFDTKLIGDVIIAKDIKTPLYNLAVVIDDAESQVTHVIRGEDHIANTPKQIVLQESLGFERPHYAHLPLILDKDRSKLSKRFAATSINEYRRDGFLPEALVNYLALLGWHPEDEKELMTIEELVAKFDLKRVQKAGAVFDIDKLKWINSHYLKQINDEKLIPLLGWVPSPKNFKIIKLVRERAQTLKDFDEWSKFFTELPDYEADLLLWKNMSPDDVIKSLKLSRELIDSEKINELPKLAEQQGRGETFWPLRAALSGLKGSPGPLEILDVLGKDESLRRVDIAIDKLKPAK